MSLSEILKIVENLIDAALGSGLIKDHPTAKQVLIARDELQKHADTAATAAPATTAAPLTAVKE